MKTLKKDLKSVVKELKALTKKAEKMSAKLDKLAKAEAKAAKNKGKTKRKVTATPKKKTLKAKRIPASDVVFKVIKRNRKGINTASIVTKTGYKEKKVRDIIYRLKNQGKVKSARTGLYVKI